MKRKILWLAVTCLMVLSLVLVSCGKTTSTTTAPAQMQTTTATITQTTATTALPTTITTKTTTPTVSTTTAGTPQYGGILRVGDWRLSVILGDPATESAGYSQREAAPAIETLLRVDKSGNVIPWLAKSWTMDPVAMTITLTLNTGIMFSDGTPFNAAAVKWNLDQDVAAKQAGYANIKSVDAVNDSTVRINLNQWDNTLLPYLGYSYIGMMISPTAFQKNGGVLWADNNPVGTGPFIFESWIPQVTISFSKNPNYWQPGEPYLDRVENVIIADQTVGLLNFKSGKTDMFVDPLASDVPALVKAYPATVLEPYAAFATTRCGAIFDSANPKSPFADVRVRQAVQYAIDPNAMNQAVLGGFGEVTNQFIPTDSWGYDPTIVGYPYNPDKAKQLLSDAGYSSGFKTNYVYTIDAESEAFATAFKGYLAAVGIDVSIQGISITTLHVAYTNWTGMVPVTPVPSPDPAGSFRDRYIGLDSRYFVDMLVPADYKQAVISAITAPDQATKTKDVQQADKLFTDKYCLAATWAIPPSVCVNQSWTHNDGLYTVANDNWWSPEVSWKDPGH